MPCMYLRPTGTSVLIGFIEIPPSNIDDFVQYLHPVMTRWGERSIRELNSAEGGSAAHHAREKTKLHPGNANNACGYVGIGPWNLLTLTMVSEKGLATNLSFIGHARGQNYTHAHDYSIVLDLQDSSWTDELGGAVRDFLEITTHAGLTDVLGLDLSKDIHLQLLRDIQPGPPHRRRREPVFYKQEPPKDLRFLAEYRPFLLNHIYSGSESIYGLLKDDPAAREKILSGNEAVHSGPTDLPTEDALLGLYQLKFEPLLKVKDYRRLKLLVFLASAVIYSEYRKGASARREEGLPTFFRPLFTDGFFDMFFLVRGKHLASMDALMLKIKTLSVHRIDHVLRGRRTQEGQVEGIDLGPLIDEELRAFVSSFPTDVPIFSVSHTTAGIPCSMIKKAETAVIDRVEALKRSHPRLIEAPRQEMLEIYDAFAEHFQGYASKVPIKDGDDDRGTMRISTMMSVKVGMLSHTQSMIEKFYDLIYGDASNDSPPRLAPPHLLNGRYDFELFRENDLMDMNEYVSRLQFFKILMNNQSGADKTFHMRSSSPILALKTKIAFPHHDNLFSIESRNYLLKRDVELTFFSRENLERVFADLEASISKLSEDDKVTVDAFRESWQFWKARLGNGAHPNMEYQAHFHTFLEMRLKHLVSPETIEMVNTVYCSVERFLSDPLLFSFYIDVYHYLSYFFQMICTVQCDLDTKSRSEMALTIRGPEETDERIDEDFEKPELVKVTYEHLKVTYFDPESESVVPLGDFNGVYKGLEAFLLHFCELTQKAFSQRQFGSFPNHDRSFSRLMDLKITHSKKLKSLSWLIRDFMKTQRDWLFESMEHYLSEIEPDQGHALQERLGEWERPGLSYLPYFSNSPELILMRTSRSISVNARHLTSFESLCMVAHEMGHIFTDSFRFEDAPHTATGTPKVHGLERDGSFDTIWEECCCDMMVFRTCFSVLSPAILDPQLKGIFDPECPRTTSWPGEREYDICDDFVLAMFFQLLLHPAPLRKRAMLDNVLRLALGLCVTKYFTHEDHVSEWSLDKLIVALVDQWDLFAETKLRRLFRKIQKHEDNPIKDKQCLSYGLLFECSENRKAGLLRTEATFFRDQLEKRLRFLFESRTRSLLFTYLKCLCLPWNRLPWDQLPERARSEYCMPQTLREPTDLFRWLNGLTPDHAQFDDASSCFAAVLQLSGMINFGFSQALKKEEYKFPYGYPGHRYHQEQQQLCRTRRLLNTLLYRGATASIREELARRGAWLDEELS
ncbi:hypothetical protein SCOR_04835 [Sulfidibacter corallicola]|uniref:Uncharacterized protein n=1 Tax=Sulfidibacter corallicola TaxID=2818388 RepID=A0A8A4TQR4_SULCO|nr:hypothetical protein [Sulfidibacter corallicola]QTD51900.1 hypothetical protein J3U87_05460 [Sulfidibacter corallicola]